VREEHGLVEPVRPMKQDDFLVLTPLAQSPWHQPAIQSPARSPSMSLQEPSHEAESEPSVVTISKMLR